MTDAPVYLDDRIAAYDATVLDQGTHLSAVELAQVAATSANAALVTQGTQRAADKAALLSQASATALTITGLRGQVTALEAQLSAATGGVPTLASIAFDSATPISAVAGFATRDAALNARLIALGA